MFFTFCLSKSFVFLYKVFFFPPHETSKPTGDSLRAQETRIEDSLNFFRNVNHYGTLPKSFLHIFCQVTEHKHCKAISHISQKNKYI